MYVSIQEIAHRKGQEAGEAIYNAAYDGFLSQFQGSAADAADAIMDNDLHDLAGEILNKIASCVGVKADAAELGRVLINTLEMHAAEYAERKL